MNTFIIFFRRTYRIRTSIAFLTCLFFMILPSCQEDEFDQDTVLLKKGKPTVTVGKVRDVDGNWYKTVKIGDQWWMAENLRTTKYNDKTTIPNVTDNTAWQNNTTGAYAWYDNDAAIYQTTYGALYNWYAVSTGNLCPTGWHVPTEAEWHQLIVFLDPNALDFPNIWESEIAGDKLKEAGYNHWLNPEADYPNYHGGTNETGFTALPGGIRGVNGDFANIGWASGWWSSTEELKDAINYWGWLRIMYCWNSSVLRGDYDERTGFYVRCLKD